MSLRDDEGTALVEFLWLGLLLLIPLAYLIVSLFQVQRSAFAAADATRAAGGRGSVPRPAPTGHNEPSSPPSSPSADEGLTIPPDAMTFSCSDSCCPDTGTLHVRLTLEATLPGLAALDRGVATIPVTGSHDEVIDRFAAAPDECP